MSGPLGSSQWMYSSGGFYPYQIEQSLRLNDDDSAYLSRTPASAGNRKTWTWSGWLKRGNLGTFQTLFGGGASSPAYDGFRFTDADKLQFFQEGATAGANRTTNAVFRDTSAWYHIVLKLNSTASEVAIFVNGVEQACTGAPPTNTDRNINNTVLHTLSRDAISAAFYFDGYMAEVNFIDGQALDPTSFGEFKSGVWIPKAYSGTYGTNGFYLPFSDGAAIGDDLSGNANDWTPSGLVAGDVLLDSPTNNYAVLNPLDGFSDGIASEGNLRALKTTAGGFTAVSSISVASGKWYFETTDYVLGNSAYRVVGLQNRTTGSTVYYLVNGSKQINGTISSYGASVAASDVVGVYLNLDDAELTFYKNGVSQGAIDISGLHTTGDMWQSVFIASGTIRPSANRFNFGQDSSFAGVKTRQGNVDANGQGDFYYAPPADALALCTANLPAPAIDPAQDDVPADYFNTVLYTGTGASLGVTGVGFQPDLTWIKGRSGATDHGLYDGVRGVQLQLESNTTAAETTETTGLTAFGTDGFTVGALAQLNTSSATYVAWNWKANGAGVANTDGTISSTVSANQKAGFSIVSYTGTGAAATVGHGLGAAPALVIIKRRSAVNSWIAIPGNSSLFDGSNVLSLESTSALIANSSFYSSYPNASVISPSISTTVNASGSTYIAYCFAEIEGYSKVGKYTGNGSTDGPFVWCGFRPAFVLVKNSSNPGEWYMLDNTRSPVNVADEFLIANQSNAEASGAILHDLVANGFKIRDTVGAWNASGNTYIFMAFAESPFKYANAR